jgi:hypothetical protein
MRWRWPRPFARWPALARSVREVVLMVGAARVQANVTPWPRAISGRPGRALLALGTTEPARSARVVVVDGGSESIGLLVDGVSEVLRVSAPMWSRPSASTTGDGPTAVLGVAKLGECLVLLLDLDAALVGASIGRADAAAIESSETRGVLVPANQGARVLSNQLAKGAEMFRAVDADHARERLTTSHTSWLLRRDRPSTLCIACADQSFRTDGWPHGRGDRADQITTHHRLRPQHTYRGIAPPGMHAPLAPT